MKHPTEPVICPACGATVPPWFPLGRPPRSGNRRGGSRTRVNRRHNQPHAFYRCSCGHFLTGEEVPPEKR